MPLHHNRPMLDALLKTLHLLAVIVWVGGMAFVQVCLRPSLAVLEAPQRIALMHAVLGRFFAVVVAASLTVLVTGLAMAARVGFMLAPDAWAMLVLGTLMVVVFAWIRGVLYPRFGVAAMAAMAAAGGGTPADAAARLAPIRRWVGFNLALGTAIVIIVGLW